MEERKEHMLPPLSGKLSGFTYTNYKTMEALLICDRNIFSIH